jgi:hypothetical protein
MEEDTMIQLNDQQLEALEKIKEFFNNDLDFFYLLGDAGSGKSFTVSLSLKDCHFLSSSVIALAPSHKAKKVLKDFLESNELNIETNTIHSALGLILTTNEDNGKNNLKKVDSDQLADKELVIVDEISMLSQELTDNLLDLQKTYRFKVLLLGDIKQLPPIGLKTFPVFELQKTEKFDQALLTQVMRYSNENLKTFIDESKKIILDNEKVVEFSQQNPNFSVTFHKFSSEKFIPKDDPTFKTLFFDEALQEFMKLRTKDAVCLAFKNETLDQIQLEIRKEIFKNCEVFKGDLPRFIEGEYYLALTQLSVYKNNLSIKSYDQFKDRILNGDPVVIKEVEKITLNEINKDFLTEIVPSKYNSQVKKDQFYSDIKEFYLITTIVNDLQILIPQNDCLSEYINSVKRHTNKLPKGKQKSFLWYHINLCKKMNSEIRIKECSSIHKSQGSSYNHVFLFDDFSGGINGSPDQKRDFDYMNSRLWYVGSSRAKQSLSIIRM